MPPTPTAPPKGKKPPTKAAGKGLTKRVGPFALWVWLAIGAGGLLIVYLILRSRGSSSGEGALGPELVTGGSVGPYEQASAGAPSENGSMASQLDPNTLNTLITDAVQPYLASAGDLRGHVYELEDAFSRAGYQIQEDKTWLPPMTAPEAILDATLGPPGGGAVRRPMPARPQPKPPKQKAPARKKPKPKPKPQRAKQPRPQQPPRKKIVQKAPPRKAPPKKKAPPRKVPARRTGGSRVVAQ